MGASDQGEGEEQGRKMSGTKTGIDHLRRVARRHEYDLAKLVAETGYWVAPSVHKCFAAFRPPHGAVYPDIRRRVGKDEEAGGSTVDPATGDTIRLDLNNYAGGALRRFLGPPPDGDWEGYHACHVWPDTATDRRYYTVLANLVLLPAPLAGLSDHDPHIIECLKYRSYQLYEWHPSEDQPPACPSNFPAVWLDPRPVPSGIQWGHWTDGKRPS